MLMLLEPVLALVLFGLEGVRPGAENGRDLFSFWLCFFCFFSIAFFTARFPPLDAMAS